MANYPDLKQATVLVTGGANGIGAATVRAFHEQGARVCFCDVDLRRGQQLAAELGGLAHFECVDLLEESQIRRWIDKIGKRWKPIRLLVNNAAADPRIPLQKTTSADWDQLFARNLRACFLTSREAAKWMANNSSAIINIASITFHKGPANMTAYVATKGGVMGFTRSLARELGPRGIRVNTLSPGWIMTERQLAQFVTPAVKKMIRAAQCIPKLIQPEEIAEVMLFLGSSGSAAITGQEILADRGWAYS